MSGTTFEFTVNQGEEYHMVALLHAGVDLLTSQLDLYPRIPQRIEKCIEGFYAMNCMQVEWDCLKLYSYSELKRIMFREMEQRSSPDDYGHKFAIASIFDAYKVNPAFPHLDPAVIRFVYYVFQQEQQIIQRTINTTERIIFQLGDVINDNISVLEKETK